MNQRKFSITTILICLWINVIRGDVCSNAKCIHASAQILQRIDTNADPCDNFYDYACGGFIEETFTPDESVAVDTFTKLKEDIDSLVSTLLDDGGDGGDAEKSNKTLTLKISRELFKTCLAKDRRSEDGDVKELQKIIETLGGWPLLKGESWDGSHWKLNETVMKIRNILGQKTDKIFDIASFIINLENANNPSIQPSATFFSLRNAYYNYISNLASFLEATGEASDRENDLNHLLDFEYKLNLINHKLQQLSGSGDIKEKSEDLRTQILLLQWLDLFHPSQLRNIAIEETDIIKSKNFADEMKNLLENTSTRTLANYVILRVVDFVVSQSISDLSDIYIHFQKLIDGREDRDQRWKECVEVVSKNLPFAIGLNYVERYFSSDTKKLAMEMFNNIKAIFTALITEAEWIDSDTRENLLNKLKSLIPLIAYPDDGFNENVISGFYDGVTFDKSQYLKTLFHLRVIDADNKFRQTYTSTVVEHSSNWKKYLPPTSLSAVYSASDNTIRFSAGILQNVVEEHNINYLNYGATGFIIAHEISHIVNQIINGEQKLSNSVEKEFVAKQQCLIEQYSQFKEPDTEEKLNGERTLVENIADNTGIKLAYRAYKDWKESLTGQRLNLIGLNYSWDQLFWISAAQTWCGVYRKEEIKRKVLSDSYATERFRVIGPLQNSPDFAKDFNCSQLSSMNRKNKCIIW